MKNTLVTAATPFILFSAAAAPPPAQGGDSLGWLWWLIPLLCVAAAVVTALLVLHRSNSTGNTDDRQGAQRKQELQSESNVVRMHVTRIGGDSWHLEVPIYHALFFGSGESANVVFKDSTIDEQQFVVEEQDGVFTITNLSSVQDTLVNNEKIDIAHPLHHGDIIAAGRELIVFE